MGLTLLLAQSSSYAASVTHIYELNGSVTDDLGGPSMVLNGGTLGPAGLTFSGGGPNLSNAINPSTYSIEMTFRINSISSWKRLLAFRNLTFLPPNDFGLYNLNGALIFIGGASGPGGAFSPGVDAHLVVTRDGSTKQFIGYVNGVQQISFTDNSDYGAFSGPNNIIHFMRDETPGSENPPGFLDRVRIYDGVLTQQETVDLFEGGSPPGLAPVPEPSTLLLLGTGLVGFVGYSRRKRRA